MHPTPRRSPILVLLSLSAAATLIACEQQPLPAAEPLEQSWSALMDDGDVGAIAPGAARLPPPASSLPPRFCPGETPPGDTSGDFGDCARAPLAFWTLDDCGPLTTQLNDYSFGPNNPHPAFRAVSAACVPGINGQGVRLAGADDVVYAPDQPDFVFDRGLTIAAWINPDRLDGVGVQTIARKRLDGSSSFVLALDGRTLVFVVRLADGRLAGATFNRIRTGRFTHVAATYDGQNAVLYADGVEVDRARARGRLASGAGPIFVGNDANGRRLRGVVDEIWLNTRAAPADQIAELSCVRQVPLARLTPEVSPPTALGAPFAFDLAITNQSTALCPADDFTFFGVAVPSGLILDPRSGAVSVVPGQTAHATVTAVLPAGSQPVSQSFTYEVSDTRGGGSATTASATLTVAPPDVPDSCAGSPPVTPQIIGAPFSPTGAQASYSFAAPGLAAPLVTPIFNFDGSTRALQVSAGPSSASDPASAFMGFGMGFFQPPCLNASAFNAVKFTVTGDLGTCTLVASLVPSEDNSTANGDFGFCTAGSACFPPQSGPIGTGVNVVHFADMTGGSPVSALNAAALNAVQWVLNAPSDGISAPCVANFTVSDVSFINDTLPPPAPPLVNYTFDTDLQGWQLNTFDEPANLVAHPPAGVSPPLFSQSAVGDPAAGSAQVTATFSAIDQYVDAIVNLPFPGLDLTGKTLHARVRLLTPRPFLPPGGGIAFHVSSGADFAFASAPLVPLFSLSPGAWVPIDLDFGNLGFASPTFDPAAIVQIGIQLNSGQGPGMPLPSAPPVILQFDTVTD